MEDNESLQIKKIIREMYDQLKEMEDLVDKKELSVSVKYDDYTFTLKISDEELERVKNAKKDKINLKKSFISNIDKVKSSKVVKAAKNAATFPFRYVNGKWNSLRVKTREKIERARTIKSSFKDSVIFFKESAGFDKSKLNKPLNNKSFVTRVSDATLTKVKDFFRPVSLEDNVANKERIEELKLQRQKLKEAQEIKSKPEPKISNNDYLSSMTDDTIIQNKPNVQVDAEKKQQKPVMTNAARFALEKTQKEEEERLAIEAEEERLRKATAFNNDKTIMTNAQRFALEKAQKEEEERLAIEAEEERLRNETAYDNKRGMSM